MKQFHSFNTNDDTIGNYSDWFWHYMTNQKIREMYMHETKSKVII
jgi:hypothetical protein